MVNSERQLLVKLTLPRHYFDVKFNINFRNFKYFTFKKPDDNLLKINTSNTYPPQVIKQTTKTISQRRGCPTYLAMKLRSKKVRQEYIKMHYRNKKRPQENYKIRTLRP